MPCKLILSVLNLYCMLNFPFESYCTTMDGRNRLMFFFWAYHGKLQVCILPGVSKGTLSLSRDALLTSFPIDYTDNIAVIARTPSGL